MPYWFITLKNTDTGKECYISLKAYRKAELKYILDRIKEYNFRAKGWWKALLRWFVTAKPGFYPGAYDGKCIWYFHESPTASEMIDIIGKYPGDDYVESDRKMRKRCKSMLRLNWRVWWRVYKYFRLPIVRVKIERVWMVCR